LETMIETFSIVGGAAAASGWSTISVMSIAPS
jgi:hypothetical protein